MARFVRLRRRSRAAEFAIVVGDRLSGRGRWPRAARATRAAGARPRRRALPRDDAGRQRRHPAADPSRLAAAPDAPLPDGQVDEFEFELAPADPLQRGAPCDDRRVRWKLTVRAGPRGQAAVASTTSSRARRARDDGGASWPSRPRATPSTSRSSASSPSSRWWRGSSWPAPSACSPACAPASTSAATARSRPTCGRVRREVMSSSARESRVRGPAPGDRQAAGPAS